MSRLTTQSRGDPGKETPTRSRLVKTIVALVAIGALVFGVATAAFASLPAGTTVTGKLKVGTDVTFNGDIDSVPITVTCTTFTVTGKVVSPASDTMKLSVPPTIKGCTDSSGGTDTIKTSGTWKATISSTTLTLVVPKDGATFTSSILSACTITAAPTAAVKIVGAYNGKNTDKVTNAKIPTKGTGCTSTTATTSATEVLSPAPGAPPW
jgi:hypothetical protein